MLISTLAKGRKIIYSTVFSQHFLYPNSSLCRCTPTTSIDLSWKDSFTSYFQQDATNPSKQRGLKIISIPLTKLDKVSSISSPPGIIRPISEASIMEPQASYIIPDPLIAAAGQQFIGQYSTNLVSNTGGWIDRNLRPLFAVDDSYVIKKLGFLLFPFAHRRWHSGHEEPKDNVVQPDLYIPLMSFMTYVLTAGYMLGLKDKFSPEQLGMISSSALGCLMLEVTLMAVLFNIFNVKTWYSFLHYIAFSGYKFVPIIASMLLSLLFKNTGYYTTIGYTTLALAYYILKSFHVAIEAANHENFDHKVSRTGIYLVGLFCLLQPLFMFWLSYHLIP